MSQKEMPEISVNFWLFRITAKGRDGVRLARWPIAVISSAAAFCIVAAALSVSLRLPHAPHWESFKAPLLGIFALVKQWAG
jgi:hypothetical protein